VAAPPPDRTTAPPGAVRPGRCPARALSGPGGTRPPDGPDLDAVPPGLELAAVLDSLPLATAADGTPVDGVAGWERVRCRIGARQAAAVSESPRHHLG
jgi:hypothetical protein